MHKATNLGSRAAAGIIPPHLVAAVGSGISKPLKDPSERRAKKTIRLQTIDNEPSSICVLIFIFNPKIVLCFTVCVCAFLGCRVSSSSAVLLTLGEHGGQEEETSPAY